jgi:hypothetical protein
MSLVRLLKLIYKVYTSYILIIIINKARNSKLLCVIAPKHLSYNTPIY